MPLQKRYCGLWLLWIAGFICLGRPVAGAEAAPQLPKVVLLGDSIRLGYAPLVAKRLAGKATVVSPAFDGGDSAALLRQVAQWAIRENPAVVHFNCGLDDLKRAKASGRHQVEPADYQGNLEQLVARLQKETTAALVFANTTPVLDARRAGRSEEFSLAEADVQRYNATAVAVMQPCGVPVHDLHWVVQQGGVEKLLDADGVHCTPAGNALLAEAVADSVLRQLAIRAIAHHFRGHASGPASAEAVARYWKDQAQRDAQVPPAFKKLPVPPLPIPTGADAWNRQRPEVLKAVVGSLGDLPTRPSPQRTRLITREIRRGYTLERVNIDNGVDSQVTALVLIPDRHPTPAPAILWLHSSTPDKNHLLIPHENGGGESLADAFVQAGYVVMAPDAYSYGDRDESIPGGPMEAYRLAIPGTYRLAEDSMVKFNLWLGRTHWGMMVRDDQIALDYLCSRPEVDPARIGATGMSMGSTRAWWLAAVDERIAATVGVACLTRYQNLIAHGELRAHGPYYFVFGLLKHCDTEGVLSLIAPRPFLALTGDLDRGSPADGIKLLEKYAGGVYRAVGAGDRFKSIVYQDTGHVYTPEMRAEMLSWFNRWLGSPKKSP
jgi:dienelactone hydrolase/lysophospholipase L1-like esterase